MTSKEREILQKQYEREKETYTRRYTEMKRVFSEKHSATIEAKKRAEFASDITRFFK